MNIGDINTDLEEYSILIHIISKKLNNMNRLKEIFRR